MYTYQKCIIISLFRGEIRFLTLSKLQCKEDYAMSLSTHNEKSNAGQSWKAYDIGHSTVHFLLPVQRARLNLESFWLGQVS